MTPRASAVVALQLYTVPIFESLLQCKLERINTVREGSIRCAFNVFFYERNRLRVFEVRSQEFTLHLLNFIMAWWAYQFGTFDPAVGENDGTHPAVTHEKVSSTTLSAEILLLMSAKALSQRGLISSLNRHVKVVHETFC